MTSFGEKTILFSVFDAQDITDNDLALMGSKIPKHRVEKAEKISPACRSDKLRHGVFPSGVYFEKIFFGNPQ